MVTMINQMVVEYTKIVDAQLHPGVLEPAEPLEEGTFFTASCIVSGFLEDTYDKYPTFTTQVIMEYSPFTPWFAAYLPSPLNENEDFKDFLLGEFD